MIFFWFLTFFLAAVNPSHAGFVAAAIGAFAASSIGGILINLAISVALSVGASLLQSLFKGRNETKDPGTSIQLRVGGDNPLFFPMGSPATGGVRIYTGTWTGGGSPNEFAVDVQAVSVIPVSGFYGFWLHDQRVTLIEDEEHAELGFPVLEYRKDGKDYAWIKFHDGTQTVADDYLLNRFGTHPNYPWKADMIGRGVAYVVLTCRYDRNGLWAGGFPSMLTEIGSINLYDIRKDSSVGGSGLHRWNDPSTWEPSNNFMVHAYNVARGIYYDGEWIYGGQNWPAFRLPLSSWATAMNACDLDVDGEPQFHGGATIECDMEPAVAIEEFLRSSSGLIAEIGGIYKVRVGAPGAPVMTFTDDAIVISKGQSLDPFPGLESTYNIVRLSYTEPVEKWSTKESPERRDAALIISDDNRELPMSVELPYVLSNTTVQRIGKTALYNGRRFRKHQHAHPPLFWIVEPLDVVGWSSAHNGYVDKSFDVEQVTGGSSLTQLFALREVDSTDYDWNPATDKLEYETVPLVPLFPAPQVLTGWQVLPAVIKDQNGIDRRASIEIRYEGDLTDIQSVRIQVRLPGETLPFYDIELPYDKTTSFPSVVLNGDFAANAEYEVRGIFVPVSDRDTVWTTWLAVTTPNVLLKPNLDFDPFTGVVGFDDLDDDIAGWQEWMADGQRQIRERLQELDARIADQEFGNAYERQQMRQSITATYEFGKAEWTEEINVVASDQLLLSSRVETLEVDLDSALLGIGANSTAIDALEVRVDTTETGIATNATAITGLESTLTTVEGDVAANATAITSLETSVTLIGDEVEAYANAITSLSAGTDPDDVNTANFRMSAVTGPTGYSRISAEARQGGGGTWRVGGWYLDVPDNDALPTRFSVLAEQFIVLATGGSENNPFVVDGTAVRMNVANIGTVTAGLIKSNDDKVQIQLDLNRIVISD